MKYTYIKYSIYIIGIVLILSICILVIVPVHHGRPRGKRIETMGKLDAIRLSIYQYYQEYGILETNRLVLQKYISKNISPYSISNTMWRDSWGNNIIVLRDSNSQWVSITSFGPDGKQSSLEKAPDDLVISQNLVNGVVSMKW